jgi:hypothetical protein
MGSARPQPVQNLASDRLIFPQFGQFMLNLHSRLDVAHPEQFSG